MKSRKWRASYRVPPHLGRDDYDMITRSSRPPSQRQLRVGEEMRHVIAAVMGRGELRDPVLAGVSLTLTEVRVSPDLKSATAFVVPLVGVHNNIQSVKRVELGRLRDEIRVERATVVNTSSDDVNPRLANLIAYYQLIDRAREWPIDAANLLKFFMYLLIGLGSWFGGALVERLLDSTLGG